MMRADLLNLKCMTYDIDMVKLSYYFLQLVLLIVICSVFSIFEFILISRLFSRFSSSVSPLISKSSSLVV